jgi:catechol 2,3-dioxygenase-like lactoylglutathione lyase family enzyme
MKRLHVHVSVADLESSIRFYRGLFAVEPTVLKPDYAKWMLDDPRVNFAISQRGGAPGVEHLGIQVERADELAEIAGRLHAAELAVRDEGHTACCYSRSEKAWTEDPSGIAWEVFHTYGESTVYGGGANAVAKGPASTRAEAPNCGCPGMATAAPESEPAGCCAPS